MAFYLNRLAVPNHLANLFASNADDSFFHTFLGAVAGKCRGYGIVNGKAQIS